MKKIICLMISAIFPGLILGESYGEAVYSSTMGKYLGRRILDAKLAGTWIGQSINLTRGVRGVTLNTAHMICVISYSASYICDEQGTNPDDSSHTLATNPWYGDIFYLAPQAYSVNLWDPGNPGYGEAQAELFTIGESSPQEATVNLIATGTEGVPGESRWEWTHLYRVPNNWPVDEVTDYSDQWEDSPALPETHDNH